LFISHESTQDGIVIPFGSPGPRHFLECCLATLNAYEGTANTNTSRARRKSRAKEGDE